MPNAIGEALSPSQFKTLMNEITRNHRFGRSGRGIKYVHPTFDMRDGRCFYVNFRGVTGPTEGVAFDFRDSADPMYDRIMAWLGGGGTK